MKKTSKERMTEKITTWSKFGDLGNGGITRRAFEPAEIQAREEFKKRIEALGMTLEIDDVGNLYATYPGKEDLPRIVVGSHMDSVISGGNYDGIYGVLSGLEAAETIIGEKIEMRHPLTVMVWTNEEGSKYEPAMMSSGIVTGKFDKDKMFAVKDRDSDLTFGKALKDSGWEGEEKYRLNSKDYCAYFEPHIEQGPVLEDGGFDIGVVKGVVGMVNYDLIFEGVSCHAGTFPQPKRKDALKAASTVILDLWDKLGAIDDELVFTFGEIELKPNVHTVVPNYVKVSLDSRHKDPEVIKQVVDIIKNIPTEVAGCKVSYEEHWGRSTIDFNEKMVGYIEDSAKELGYTYHEMYSGAGHDAQYVADILPATMLFIPSKDGLSHTIVEYSSPDQTWHGANVLLNAILKCDAEFDK